MDFESGEKNEADKEGNSIFLDYYNNISYLWTKENGTFMENIDNNNNNYKFCFYDKYNYIYDLKLLYVGNYNDRGLFYIKTDGNDNNDILLLIKHVRLLIVFYLLFSFIMLVLK